MKKTWLRLLSVFLTVALLIPLFATTASAASKITLRDGSPAPANIVIGSAYSLKVAGTAVKFYSSNKAVAIINSTTGKLSPISPGSVKITAKSQRTGEVVATKTFKVLRRAKSVSADVETLYLNPGETYTLKATLSPATSTDVITFTTGDTAVASVGATSGTVTAKAVGTTWIRIYAKATKGTANDDNSNRMATVSVIVQEPPISAEITGENKNQLKLTFLEDMPDSVTAGNFTVIQTAVESKASKTIGIVSAVRYSSRELLLTLAEPVFSATETSKAGLIFSSPDEEVCKTSYVDLGRRSIEPPSLVGGKCSGNEGIKEGTSGFLQFYGLDQNYEQCPLNNVTVNIISYTTKETVALSDAGAVVDKVSFSQKKLSDGSIVVTFAAPVGTVLEGTNSTRFAFRLTNEKGQMVFTATTGVTRAEAGAAYRLRFVSPEGEELFTPLTVKAGSTYQTPTPSKEGYTFKGWTRSDGAGGNVMPQQDLTLTAVWEKAGTTTTITTQTATVSLEDWTYGSPKSPILKDGPKDALAVSYQYKQAKANELAWSEAVPTDAGDYQVRVVITVAENAKVYTAPVAFTIEPKEVTITGTAVEPSKPYDGDDGAEITDSGTLSGVVDGDNVTIIPGIAAYSDGEVGTGKTVTFTDFAIAGADVGNYVLAAQPAPVTADITAPPQEISVEIAWDDMSFTYTAPSKGTWNPETHQYDNVTEGGWTSAGGNITVTNNGSETVAASFSYSPAEGMSGITGVFSQALLTVEPEKQATAKLTLSGTPTETFENRQLGAVSVTVSKP